MEGGDPVVSYVLSHLPSYPSSCQPILLLLFSLGCLLSSCSVPGLPKRVRMLCARVTLSVEEHAFTRYSQKPAEAQRREKILPAKSKENSMQMVFELDLEG